MLTTLKMEIIGQVISVLMETDNLL